MVPSSADIVIQNRRISQSETNARTICDVVNITPLQRARVSVDQNVSSSLGYIPTNEPCRALGCDLIILPLFYYPIDKSSELPG